MVFSSLPFLFYFLPAALIIYFLVPRKAKNLSLLILSMVFYSWGEVRYFPIMLASILVDFVASNGIENHRDDKRRCQLYLWLSVVFNLGMLGFFKYAGFFMRNLNALTGLALPILSLTLPLGISFYTFQTMSYTIDVYRGKVTAERNIIDFGAFVVLFPQLIAGPIVRYTDISRELKERRVDLEQISRGVETFILGMGSKVLIANNIGALWTAVEAGGFAGISAPQAWLAVLAYALQIYFDFSGYSLMAIGLGRMLGFEFPQNFDYPYISKSITEFWRRWHMTLGSWFREYLYFPLGGSRCSKGRAIFNLFIVWGLTGLWHGAEWNFVLWGLYFFALIGIEKMGLLVQLERHAVLSRVYVFFMLMFSWVIFANTNFGNIGALFSAMFSFAGGTDWLYTLRNYGVSILLGIVLATPVLKPLFLRLQKNRLLAVLLYGAVLYISIAYLVDSSYNPFLYFRF